MANLNIDPQAVERQRRFDFALGFLKAAEVKYPHLAQRLPSMLSDMLGSHTFDPQLMIQNEKYINGGLAFLGEWLSRAGFGGFQVKNLGIVDSGVKVAAGSVASLPNRDQFFSQSGISSEYWQQLQDAMEDLSFVIDQSLEVGYQPKQILATLFIQSTAALGNERPETSIPTRDMLIKASGNQLGQVNQILNRWVQG